MRNEWPKLDLCGWECFFIDDVKVLFGKPKEMLLWKGFVIPFVHLVADWKKANYVVVLEKLEKFAIIRSCQTTFAAFSLQTSHTAQLWMVLAEARIELFTTPSPNRKRAQLWFLTRSSHPFITCTLTLILIPFENAHKVRIHKKLTETEGVGESPWSDSNASSDNVERCFHFHSF